MDQVEWVVCRGSERAVVGDRVDCPIPETRPSRAIRLEDCMECRHLIATPVDRQLGAMCSTGEPRLE